MLCLYTVKAFFLYICAIQIKYYSLNEISIPYTHRFPPFSLRQYS